MRFSGVVNSCITLVLLSGLSGCGFHLRSSADMPAVMQRTYLNIPSGNDDLVREFYRNLSTDKDSIVTDPAQATATINILKAERFRRTLSVSNIGRPLEIEIAYQVEFSLTSPNGTLIQPQTLTRTRNFAYEEANALADTEQSDVLYSTMEKDMAQLILFKIKALKHKHHSAGGTH